MKPNSDFHYNQMPNNEPFKQGLGYMVSIKLEECHELIAAKERVEALEREIKTLEALLKEASK